jgi:hypothetical protein
VLGSCHVMILKCMLKIGQVVDFRNPTNDPSVSVMHYIF